MKDKKLWNDFKAFIMRGNIMDMAIGVIMGGAFGKIVTSLVNDLLMPTVGLIMGGLNFSELAITVKDTSIAYGLFIQSLIDFLIVAVCMFFMVRLMATLAHKKKEEEEKKEEAPAPKSDEVLLLEEIRDLLKKAEEKND